MIPWSPLARGRVTGPWDTGATRSETDEFGRSSYRDRDEDARIVEQVEGVAAARGVSVAQVALAWVLAQSMVARRS